MNRTEFTLENLKALDFGLIGAAFDAELQHVVKDCTERPMDDGPRKVTEVQAAKHFNQCFGQLIFDWALNRKAVG